MNTGMNWKVGLGFLALLACTFFFLGYEQVFFLGPQGIHFIRQTDSLSFVSQYYNTGSHFFETRLFNLESMEARGMCEFPILYYITAKAYTIFGEKVYLLKVINLSIVYAGVYSVFNMSYLILKDYAYANLIALFLMASTVFNYYALNYLPDPAALGFVLIGWHFFFLFETQKKNWGLLLSFFFFTLAGLIKVTFLISPLAIIVHCISSLLFKQMVFNKAIRFYLIALILGVVIVALYNVYVIYYNALYQSDYFTTGSRPIWSLSSENIGIVWDYITVYWYHIYFSRTSFHMLLGFIILQMVFFKKSSPKIATLTGILCLGSLAYFILFYAQFRDHDYYFLVFIPLIVFIIINAIKTSQNMVPSKKIHLVAKIGLIAVVIYGINFSRRKLEKRYEAGYDRFSRIAFIIQNEMPSIEKLEIPKDAKVIVAPDLSVNGGLFALNRIGWEIDKTDQITSELIEEYRSLGAKYLFLASNDEEAVEVGRNSGELVYQGAKLSVFKLRE